MDVFLTHKHCHHVLALEQLLAQPCLQECNTRHELSHGNFWHSHVYKSATQGTDYHMGTSGTAMSTRVQHKARIITWELLAQPCLQECNTRHGLSHGNFWHSHVYKSATQGTDYHMGTSGKAMSTRVQHKARIITWELLAQPCLQECNTRHGLSHGNFWHSHVYKSATQGTDYHMGTSGTAMSTRVQHKARIITWELLAQPCLQECNTRHGLSHGNFWHSHVYKSATQGTDYHMGTSGTAMSTRVQHKARIITWELLAQPCLQECNTRHGLSHGNFWHSHVYKSATQGTDYHMGTSGTAMSTRVQHKARIITWELLAQPCLQECNTRHELSHGNLSGGKHLDASIGIF